MPKALDLTGQKFGKLTVISKSDSKNGKTYWLCRCECGKEKEVQTAHLRSGAIKSCGSLKCKNSQKSNQYLKVCPICNKQFYTDINRRIYCYECSPLQSEGGSEYQKTKQRAIKHQLILYKGGKCERCGYDKCEGALQFHHKDPSKKEFTLSQINLSKELNMDMLYKEIDKCELLCANCHAEEHYS